MFKAKFSGRLFSWGFGLLVLAVSLVPSRETYAMGRKPSIFSIQLKVDFGPAGKPTYEQTLEVVRGTTPKEAVMQVFAVKSGRVCCSPRDVEAIDGVGVKPEENLWWICILNGSRNVGPYTTKLKSGDRLEWRYLQEVKCPMKSAKSTTPVAAAEKGTSPEAIKNA